jgi:signal transduction histidine kinase
LNTEAIFEYSYPMNYENYEHIKKAFYKNIVISGTSILFIYTVLYFYFQAYFAAISCLFIIFISVPTMLFLVKGKAAYSARMLTVISINLCLTTIALGLRNQVNSEYFYLPAMMLSLLLYEPEQKNEIAFSIFLPVISWISLNIFPNPLEGTMWLSPPNFPYKSFSVLNFVGATFLTYLFLRFYLQSILKSRQIEIANEHKLMIASKMASLGELATGIAHEINNPLSIIVGRTQILKSKVEDFKAMRSEDLESCVQNLTKIEETANLIAKIIRGLNAFSRNTENDPMTMHSVRTIIDFAIDLCEDRLKSNQITITVREGRDTDILCRDVQITQVLVNLINNSIDAVDGLQEKWIEISASITPKKVVISVKDSGKGIAPHLVDKIMQPFFSTKEIGKGIGLGLSISKGIAESHNGKISYDPLCENTKFDLELPRTNDTE